MVFDKPAFSAPVQGLIKMVAAYGYVRRNYAQARRSATKEHAFCGSFYVVVRNLERPVAAPSAKSLALVALSLDVRKIAVKDAHGAGVERDAASLSIRRMAVHPDAIKLEIMRQLFKTFLLARAELNYVALTAGHRAELYGYEAEV